MSQTKGKYYCQNCADKKPTQVDKYLRKHRTRRIYNRTVLVTITQNVPDKLTRRSKKHFVSISVSSSLTKVTLECPDLSRGSGLDNNQGRFLFNHYQKWICRVQVSVKSRSRYRRRARFWVAGLDWTPQLTNSSLRFGPSPMPTLLYC